MFEHRHEPLLPRKRFFSRLTRHFCIGLAMMFTSLGIGIVGYRVTEGISWLDSLLNASMILSGMGPAQDLHHDAAKWFASFYALFSGVAFITTVGVLFAPVVHRFLHKFHVEMETKKK
jgi:hypothetical protein